MIRNWFSRRPLLASASLAVIALGVAIWWRFSADMTAARTRVAYGSTVIETRCGPIEYQEAGTGVPLLAVHGSGGGFDQGIMIGNVLAAPPDLLKDASLAERARINTMLDEILPVSARAAGLRSDSAVGKHLAPSPLEKVRAPTLIISARDDGYGTYASAHYTAERSSLASKPEDTRGSDMTTR
jgi:hypothetical protein